MKSPDALRRAADVVEACAIGDDTDALLVLWARIIERKAMGTCHADEVAALVMLTLG
jgi:hypothetical protein